MSRWLDMLGSCCGPALDAAPALLGLGAAAIMFLPCAACRTVTYAECKEACGEFAVEQYRPGFHTMAVACSCSKSEPRKEP